MGYAPRTTSGGITVVYRALAVCEYMDGCLHAERLHPAD
ncbi:hypothetical protein BBJK_00046 [Bifidobacterium bifidum LMG 13195]|uniref:Uncharacterized protein n=1 Tax=Bifidobacterium bifidum LMG 13195 TaxID=1207542 RepID=A0A286T9I4_BIFBI|nr:hypothetical protein BBJK_00046 [Bifidobacterium bifidum LMG 13195]